MEIYRDAYQTQLDLGVPPATNITATVSKLGLENAVLTATDQYTLPYRFVAADGEITVKWDYSVDGDVFTRTTKINVVTSLFNLSQLQAFNPHFADYTEEQFAILEKFCRTLIESHTGQTFGFEYAAIPVFGQLRGTIYADRRILEAESISGIHLPPMSYSLSDNRFAMSNIRGTWYTNVGTYPQVIPIEYVQDTGVIYDIKSDAYLRYKGSGDAILVGWFGWEMVPDDITQAALLFAELVSCKEGSWRDRYLRAVRAADFRFDFDQRAWEGTGSASIDKILEKYIVSGIAII